MQKVWGFIGGCLVATTTWAAFVDPNLEQVSTVADVLQMKNDTMVSVRGKIQKQVKKNKYLFSDDTGSVIVEIKPKTWRGLDVGPNDAVHISGEVDRDWSSLEIEAETIGIIKY